MAPSRTRPAERRTPSSPDAAISSVRSTGPTKGRSSAPTRSRWARARRSTTRAGTTTGRCDRSGSAARRRAAAHVVPVPPSTCVFDPVTIEAPVSGTVGTAAPPGSADQFRILYDPQASQAEFDLQSVPPRTFTAAGVEGTFALPGIVFAALRNSGDLTVATSLSFTMNGSTTAVPMTLTTGVAAAAGMVVEGMPIASDGRFVLVGITADSGLGPPLGGALPAARPPCQAVPRPDTDQFRLATRTTPVSATLTARALNLRAIFAPGAMDVPDFPASPALLRASSGNTTITTVDLPSGLPAPAPNPPSAHTAAARPAPAA